jgi:hypothetical protein
MRSDSPSPSWYEPLPEIKGPCYHGDSRSCRCEDSDYDEDEEWGPDSATQMLERGPR